MPIKNGPNDLDAGEVVNCVDADCKPAERPCIQWEPNCAPLPVGDEISLVIGPSFSRQDHEIDDPIDCEDCDNFGPDCEEVCNLEDPDEGIVEEIANRVTKPNQRKMINLNNN